MSTKYELGSTK